MNTPPTVLARIGRPPLPPGSRLSDRSLSKASNIPVEKTAAELKGTPRESPMRFVGLENREDRVTSSGIKGWLEIKEEGIFTFWKERLVIVDNARIEIFEPGNVSRLEYYDLTLINNGTYLLNRISASGTPAVFSFQTPGGFRDCQMRASKKSNLAMIKWELEIVRAISEGQSRVESKPPKVRNLSGNVAAAARDLASDSGSSVRGSPWGSRANSRTNSRQNSPAPRLEGYGEASENSPFRRVSKGDETASEIYLRRRNEFEHNAAVIEAVIDQVKDTESDDVAMEDNIMYERDSTGSPSRSFSQRWLPKFLSGAEEEFEHTDDFVKMWVEVRDCGSWLSFYQGRWAVVEDECLRLFKEGTTVEEDRFEFSKLGNGKYNVVRSETSKGLVITLSTPGDFRNREFRIFHKRSNKHQLVKFADSLEEHMGRGIRCYKAGRQKLIDEDLVAAI